MDISEYLSIHAHMNPLDTRLAILIAMLHDIGRFEQLKRFDSFDDSIIDHAKIGIDVLFKQKKIRNFIKTDEYDQIIYDAIEQHSLYAIDESLEGKSLLHARLIRDSDKLDNYRVKNTESIKTLFGIDQAEFEIETVSPNILEDIMNHRLIVKDDRTTHLDMYVSYLAFAFDLNFKASYQWLKESDYIEKNIDRFTYYHAYKEMYQIKKELLAYIDEKISEDL